MNGFRFTVRRLMLGVAAAALSFLLLNPTYGGRAWMTGLLAAVAGLLLIAVVHVAFYGTAGLLARRVGDQDVVARTSRGAIEHTQFVELEQTPARFAKPETST